MLSRRYSGFQKKPGLAPGLNQRQQGFVVTLEILLLVTVLVLGSLAGIVAIRDALIKHYVSKQSQKTLVVDDEGRVLGEAVDYDEHDAPRLFYIDRTRDLNYRVLIGVRDDRFTSREPIYYQGSSCMGDPCIKTTSDEGTDNSGADRVSGSGAVSYFNALQGQPNYAVGRGLTGLPGALFSESSNECPIPPGAIGSRWNSQNVVTGVPCESFSFDDDGASEPAYTSCLVDTLQPCECPNGFDDEADLLGTYLPAIETQVASTLTAVNALLSGGGRLPTRLDTPDIGTLCCPDALQLQGSDLVDAVTFVVVSTVVQDLGLSPILQTAVDQVLAPLDKDIACESFVQLKAALSVPDANDSDSNALEQFSAPFRINLPSGAGTDEWTSTPPAAMEGGRSLP